MLEPDSSKDERSAKPNRRHLRSKEVRGLLLLTLCLICIILGVLFIYWFRFNIPKPGEISSTTSTTITVSSTRFHRFPSVTSQSKVSDDELVYQALVYTDHPACTNIARSVLLRNGNAADAVIAALFCLSAAHPHNTGLGGGLFANMAIRGKCVIVDARETASRSVTIDNFINNTDQIAVGITSVGIPSFLPGIHTLFTTSSGNFKLSELAQPTIDLCNSGILVDESLGTALSRHRDLIINDYVAKVHFFNVSSNDVYKKGDRMYCSKYSQTLSEIVELEINHEYFDQKLFSEQIVFDMEEAGGYIRQDDLDDYVTRKSNGESVKVGDFTLCGPGAPSSFVITALAAQASQKSNLGIETIFPLAYREIKKIGDYDVDGSRLTVSPMFKEPFLKQFVEKMEAGERTVLESYDIPDHSTVLAADEHGRAVIVTASLGDTFGSRFLSRQGFFYNNALSSFKRPTHVNFTGTLDPEMINVLQPGKAPRTLISPVIGFYGSEIAFFTSGADLQKQIGTINCLVDQKECLPDENLAPAIRHVENGYVPLVPDDIKMAGY